MSISDKVSESVLSNSFVFLNKAIHELCLHDDSDGNPFDMGYCNFVGITNSDCVRANTYRLRS